MCFCVLCDVTRCSGCFFLFADDLIVLKSKAVPLHAMEALGGRGGIAPTHSRPRH
jgi:hypothetical protein